MSVSVTARVWVLLLVGLLIVSGVNGTEAWPLTGWRLFSRSRDAAQTEWTLDALSAKGSFEIDLEQLPLAFRNAGWPLADLERATPRRRRAVCVALLGGVRSAVPGVQALRLIREERTMRIVEGDPLIAERREVVHECAG